MGGKSNGTLSNGHGPGQQTNVQQEKNIMAQSPGDYEVPVLEGRSKGFWGAAGLAGFVWAVTPISWIALYIFLTSKSSLGDYSVFSRIVIGYSFMEVPFSLYYQWLAHKAQQINPQPTFNYEKMRGLLMECLDVGIVDPDEVPKMSSKRSPTLLDMETIPDSSAALFRRKVRMWFFWATLDDIYRDNVKEWLAWALVGAPLEVAASQAEPNRLLEECINWVELRVKHKLPLGYNPKTKCIRLTLDPVLILSRPMAYYIVCNGITLVTEAWLCYAHGFRREHSKGCSFLVREAGSREIDTEKFQLPIIFLHGLGIGLAQYVAFLKHLTRSNQPVIILTQPAISTSIWHPRFLNPPEPVGHAEAITEVANRMGIKKATVISHSNGTMVHSWLLRHNSSLCARSILVDPVCFRLWEGDVCFNFLHKRWSTGLEMLLGYFVAREIGTAHSIGRDFQWYDMIMWTREIPNLSPESFHVVLGGKDILIDSVSIVRYLKDNNVDDRCVTFMKDYNHGKALIVDKQGMKEVLKRL